MEKTKLRKMITFLAVLLVTAAFAGCMGDNGGDGGDGGTGGDGTGGDGTGGDGDGGTGGDGGDGTGDGGDGGDTGRTSSDELYGITSGGTGGVYYPIANGIAAAASNSSTVQFSFEVSDSGGSQQNAERLRSGSHEWATMQNDVAYYAVNGLPPFSEAVPSIKAVASLYPEMIQVVTLEESGLQTIQDLEGQRVVLGAPGSGAAVNAGQVLNASGVTAETQYLELSQAAEQLKDGNVDAVFWTGGVPTGAIVSLATTDPVRILEIDEETKQNLQSEYPFYADATLAAGTYEGVDEDVNTVAITAVLVVHESVPEDDVYLLTQMLFESGDVQNAHAQAQNIQLDSAFAGLDRVPFHPGAAAYYEDQGMTVPDADADSS